MSDQPNDVRASAMADLEFALRHGPARSMKPDMPLPLRIQFYRTIASMMHTLCQRRQSAGLPRGLSSELIVLLSKVCANAAQRLPADPTNSLSLGLLGTIEKLRRAVVFALPEQRKAKNPPLRPGALQGHGRSGPATAVQLHRLHKG